MQINTNLKSMSISEEKTFHNHFRKVVVTKYKEDCFGLNFFIGETQISTVVLVPKEVATYLICGFFSSYKLQLMYVEGMFFEVLENTPEIEVCKAHSSILFMVSNMPKYWTARYTLYLPDWCLSALIDRLDEGENYKVRSSLEGDWYHYTSALEATDKIFEILFGEDNENYLS